MFRAWSSVVGVLVLLGVLGFVACGDDGRGNRKARTAVRPPVNRLPPTRELPNADGVDPELKKQLDRVAGCFRREVRCGFDGLWWARTSTVVDAR